MNQNMDSYQESKPTNANPPANTSQQRQVACIVKITDLIEGQYVKEEGWNPNYILTKNNRRISRVNLLGVIVDIGDAQDLPYNSLILDDGSGKISIRDFEKSQILKNIKIGEMIILIGKPREYFGEKYIIPEIIKKMEDKKWIEVRKLQHKLLQLKQPETKTPTSEDKEIDENINISVDETITNEEAVEEVKETMEPEINEISETKNINKSPAQEILDCIKELDTGEGADIESVLKKFPNTDSEKIIDNLLKEGEIFETKPGKVKILS